jgi:anthranilate phosphoribosyltransferase
MSFRITLTQLLTERKIPGKDHLSNCGEILAGGGRLGWEDTAQVIRLLMESTDCEEDRLHFLRLFHPKVATGEMLAAAAGVLQHHASQVPFEAEVLFDSCGTGGDRLGLFNISTLAGLVVASAGVPVVKHGNRAITSHCGSADLLEGLEIAIELTPEQAAESLEKHSFAFLFAPSYHQATRNIQPLRKKLSAEGIPTLFNLLGPLSNPARPSHQLVGVFHPDFLEPMAEALALLGLHKAWVVCGEAGEESWMDEISACGATQIASLGADGSIARANFSRSILPIPKIEIGDLLGGEIQDNLAIAQSILSGDETPPAWAVCLNAGAAFELLDLVDSLAEGVEKARDLLQSGKVRDTVDGLREFGKGLSG